MRKKLIIILVTISLIGILGTGYYFLFQNPDRAGNTVVSNTFGWKFPVVKFPITGPNEIAYSDIRDPGGIPKGLPVRLKIPIIGVDSTIEDALITPDGRMDVPSGSVNVAWFALGPHPGQIGSAVIGGHFGIRNGIPFVFYKLDKLKIGDKVYIEDDKSDILAFQIRSIKLFDRNADATTVFTSNDGLAHLNLITCEGIWNQIKGSYPERRVVFTDFVSAGSEMVGKTENIAFHQTLHIGSRGVDVVTLQTLIGITPADGIFGPKTKIKVGVWQTENGLISDGVFGPASRAKLAFQEVEPSLPSTSLKPSSSVVSETATILTQYIKSSYATPIDGIITSSLVVLIILLVLKIIL